MINHLLSFDKDNNFYESFIDSPDNKVAAEHRVAVELSTSLTTFATEADK